MLFRSVGPAGLAKDIVEKIRTAAVKALNDADVKKRLADGGSIIDGGTPEQFLQKSQRELALRRDIVKKQKIVLE